MRGRRSKPLAGLVVALVAFILAGAPSCSGPCQGNEQPFCTPGGAQCVCAAICESYEECTTAEPTEARYCYLDIGGDVNAGVCLPALFFQGPCDDGAMCTAGQCDARTGACDLLCMHSSECTVSHCCSLGADGSANPTCSSGGQCLP